MLNQKYVVVPAANILFKLAARQISFEGMHTYQEKYKDIVSGCNDSPLKIFSTIKLDEYEPFQEWLPWLIKNKEKVILILVHNMLKGDIYAERIFDIIQHSTNHPELSLNQSNIDIGTDLFNRLVKLGGGQDAFAVLNAENWLASEEVTKIVGDFDNTHHSDTAHDTLCTVNGILGVSNSHIDCE